MLLSLPALVSEHFYTASMILCKAKKGKSKANVVDIAELVVDLYNAARSANLKTECEIIPVIATNFGLEEMDR